MQMTQSSSFLFFSIIFAILGIGLTLFYFLKKRRCTAPLTERQIYVGNLSYKSNDETLETHFLQYGSIEKVHIVKNRRTGRSKGYAFVTFNDRISAQNALKANGETFLERVLVVHIAKPR